MATLPRLIPTSDVGAGNWVNQSFAVGPLWSTIDDDPFGSNDADYIQGAAGATTAACNLHLTDVPGDFDSMLTLAFRVRGRMGAGWNDDNVTLSVSVVDGSGFNLAGLNTTTPESYDADVTHGSTWSATTSRAFTYVDTAAVAATWNDARLRLSYVYDQQMSPDGARFQIASVEITGTYTEAAAPGLVIPRRQLTTVRM